MSNNSYKSINIEAENNELILKNSHGDHVIIPAKNRKWVQKKLKEGCNDCIDSLVATLPTVKDYAEDGSLIPKDSKPVKLVTLPEVVIRDTPTEEGKYAMEWEDKNPYFPYVETNEYIKRFQPEKIAMKERSHRAEWERKRDNYVEIQKDRAAKIAKEMANPEGSKWVGYRTTHKERLAIIDENARDLLEWKNKPLEEKAAYWGAETALAVVPEVAALKWASRAVPNKGKVINKLIKPKSAPKNIPNTMKTKPQAKPSQFKSEINWGKWNSEIPTNKKLLEEYHQIEKQTKANGTWMKNPDGSSFRGTPEQFIQQQSENFKKAYPKGAEITYRGTTHHGFGLAENRPIFSATKDTAEGYANYGKKSYLLPTDPPEKAGLYKLYRKNTDNYIELDALNADWTNIGIDFRDMNKIKKIANEELVSKEKSLELTKKRLSKFKKQKDGTWKYKDSIWTDDQYNYSLTLAEDMYNRAKFRVDNINKIINNPQEVEKMRKTLGNYTITDDIAEYIKNNNIDFIKLNNIHDGPFGDVTITRHAKNNFLKSAIGNNGMFDMTNPNIYKSILPLSMSSQLINNVEDENKNKNKNKKKKQRTLPKAKF